MAMASLPAYKRVDDLREHWHPCRARTLREGGKEPRPGPVVYWMSRDQRAEDNWALIHAQQLACDAGVPLHVCFCLQDAFLGATRRHFGFMLRGLRELAPTLEALGMPFHLLRGPPERVLVDFVRAQGVATVVTDFSPLRISTEWKSAVAAALPATTALIEVDAHNVVPVWYASPKQEVGARTLRPRVNRSLPTFLTEFPALKRHPHHAPASASPDAGAAALEDVDAMLDALDLDASVAEVDWCAPGAAAAHATLASFCTERLKIFGAKRNDPNARALSNLSPYFHFGQLAPQRAALAVQGVRAHHDSVKAFLEEAIVRRELSDNFCFYNPKYDSLEGAATWARESLAKHAGDPRDYVYSLEQLEGAQTHEDLWNAAQRELVVTGKLHGFMRMYWAKKILEWTESPGQALRIANALNDRYSIDGRDPNGYVGVAWSVMGVHDMGWAERAVFGKIRYMNLNGCKRKFDVESYCRRWNGQGADATAKRKASDFFKAPPTKKPAASSSS